MRNGKLITAFQNRRWDSDFRTVKKIIDGGLLGDIVEYEAHFDRFRNYFKNNWREKNIPGSGILYDLGSHLIDQAVSLFGNPIEVFGNLLIQRRGGEAVDNFEVILRYQDKKVTLKSGMLVRQPLPHFIVIGTKGSFIKYGMDVQEENLKNGNTPSNSPNWGRETEDLWGFINSDINGNHIIGKVESEPGDYRCFYENVYKAILAGIISKAYAGSKYNKDFKWLLEAIQKDVVDSFSAVQVLKDFYNSIVQHGVRYSLYKTQQREGC